MSAAAEQPSKKRRVQNGSGVAPRRPAKEGEAAAVAPEDPHVEKLRAGGYPTWQIAYLGDVTRTLAPGIKGINLKATLPDSGRGGVRPMVGRAYTVFGPDIYLNALEGVPPGAVWVQGGSNGRDAVFSPGWTTAYLKPRGGVGVVVDGGVYKSYEAHTAAVPMFCAFASPRPATNRKEGRVGETVVIGGVSVSPGDIVMGDLDGVVVIPQECEDELFEKLDAFIGGNGAFGKIAAQALKDGVPLTEEPALADMFRRKYLNPDGYWRDYEPWWENWKDKEPYKTLANTEGTSSFYSGGAAKGS